MIGPDTLRLRLETRRNEYPEAYAREAERWLLEKQVEADRRDAERFKKVLRWTIVAAIAGVVAAIGGVIAAVFAIFPHTLG